MRAATLPGSRRQRDQNLTKLTRQILKRHNAAIRERDRPVWNRNAWRNVRIKKRIVERVAEKEKRSAVMMSVYEADTSEPEAIWARITVAIRIPVAVWRRNVSHVSPGFSLVSPHHSNGLLLRRSPCQPHGVLRHSGANLSLPHQRLIAWRKAIEDFSMI